MTAEGTNDTATQPADTRNPNAANQQTTGRQTTNQQATGESATTAPETAPEDPRDWITELCLGSNSTCPGDLLEQVMDDPRCVPFGPIHHYIDGAVLLACHRNAEQNEAQVRNEQLAADLAELRNRSSNVPGAACARWGVCGAAASVGMAYAIVAENAPLKKEGWSDGQLMVARALQKIASTGSPRCCKRDSRIAVEEATRTFAADFNSGVTLPTTAPTCHFMEYNSVCMGPACPYYPNR